MLANKRCCIRAPVYVQTPSQVVGAHSLTFKHTDLYHLGVGHDHWSLSVCLHVLRKFSCHICRKDKTGVIFEYKTRLYLLTCTASM
jgi:hypothetical protein